MVEMLVQREYNAHFIELDQILKKDINLVDFIDLYPNYPIAVVVREFLILKQEQWANTYVNAINYITQVAKDLIVTYEGNKDFYIKNDFDDESLSLASSINNVLSVVAEYPIAEAVGEEKRTFQWLVDDDGDWDLQLGSKPMSAILDYAVVSSQVPQFEKERNEVNRENYHRLVTGRKTGDRRVFVEFSPSPKLTKKALKRGYFGGSCIFVYKYDDLTGQEVSTQYWVNKNWSEFSHLLKEFGLPVEEEISDVDIMAKSDFVDSNQLSTVYRFIGKQHVVDEVGYELIEYKDTHIRNYLEKELEQFLYKAAVKLIQGLDISEELNVIITTLTYAQNKLKERINKETGIQTKFVSIAREEQAFLDTDPYARALYVMQRQEEMPLVGCGTNTSSIFGNFDSITKPFNIDGVVEIDSDQYGPLEFECPHCERIVRRPKGELIRYCPHTDCGEDVTC